jgi:hypothetical protein
VQHTCSNSCTPSSPFSIVSSNFCSLLRGAGVMLYMQDSDPLLELFWSGPAFVLSKG